MSGRGRKDAAAAAAPDPINASLNKLISLLPMEQLNHSSNVNYATRFMPLVEKMMLEFEEDRRNIKKQLREIVEDSEVPRTPKRNPPGALAWKRINEYKQMLDFDEEDVDTTNFLDESISTNNQQTPLCAPPSKKYCAAKTQTPVQEPTDDSDGTLTHSRMATPPPGPSGIVTRVQASAEADKKQQAPTPAEDMDPEPPATPEDHLRVAYQQTAAMPKRKGGKAAATGALATNDEASPHHSSTDASPQLTKDELRKKRKEEANRRREKNIQAKAEKPKRKNEEDKRRAEMNRKILEEEQRKKTEDAKAQDERVRQFQVQQRHDAQPFSPRGAPAAAAGGSQLRTPARGPTFVSVVPNRFAQSTRAAAAMPGSPGHMAVPCKKQKAAPIFMCFRPRADETPTPVHTEVNCKPVRPQGGAAANKTNMDDAEGEELERQRREDRQLEEEEKERQRHGEEEATARHHQEQQEEASSAAPANATYTVTADASSANNTARTYVVDKTHLGGSTSEDNTTFPTWTVANNTTLPQGDAFKEDQQDYVVEDTVVADVERSLSEIYEEDEQLDIDEQAEEHRVPVAEMETDVVADSMLSDDDFQEQETEQATYDMTLEKVFLPATESNYNVDDLSSNDETDDEENPRKKVPSWATKYELKPHVHRQREVLPEEAREKYFGRVVQPSVGLFFAGTKKKFKARSSSAHWDSPMAEPTRGESRLKQLRAVKE